QCDVPVEVVMGASAAPRPPAGGHAHLTAGFESLSVSAAAPLDRARFQQWLTALPGGVFRAKGFGAVAGDPRRPLVPRVGERNELTVGANGAAAQETSLVLIGRGLDRDALVRSFGEIQTTTKGDIDGG